MKKTISFIFTYSFYLLLAQTGWANAASVEPPQIDFMVRKVDAGDKQALSELEKIGKAGSVQAQYHLGLYYAYRDEKTGLNWFRLAANQGHCDSLIYLGSYYRDTSLPLSLAIEKLAIDKAEQSNNFTDFSCVKSAKSNWPIRYGQLKEEQQTTIEKLAEEMQKPNNFLKTIDRFLSQ